MIKLSISNIAWTKENDNKMYEYLKDVKFDAIEIAPTRIFEDKPYDRIEEAKQFANKLNEDYNLKISSMQSIWFGRIEKVFGTKEERQELLEYTKKAIDFAETIGCKNLVFGCPKNRNMEKTEDYNIAIKFFKQIGDYAKAHNTIFAIEPNPTIYNTNFINTTQEAFNIVKEIDCEAVKVNIDLGTIIQNNEKLDVLENNYKLINHIHISEPNLEIIKERQIHNNLAQILKNNAYSNYISIEMRKGYNFSEIRKTIKYVKGVFK